MQSIPSWGTAGRQIGGTGFLGNEFGGNMPRAANRGPVHLDKKERTPEGGPRRTAWGLEIDETAQPLLLEGIGLRSVGQLGGANEEGVREQGQNALASTAAGFVAVDKKCHRAGSAVGQERDLIRRY